MVHFGSRTKKWSFGQNQSQSGFFGRFFGQSQENMKFWIQTFQVRRNPSSQKEGRSNFKLDQNFNRIWDLPNKSPNESSRGLASQNVHISTGCSTILPRLLFYALFDSPRIQCVQRSLENGRSQALSSPYIPFYRLYKPFLCFIDRKR